MSIETIHIWPGDENKIQIKLIKLRLVEILLEAQSTARARAGVSWNLGSVTHLSPPPPTRLISPGAARSCLCFPVCRSAFWNMQITRVAPIMATALLAALSRYNSARQGNFVASLFRWIFRDTYLLVRTQPSGDEKFRWWWPLMDW